MTPLDSGHSQARPKRVSSVQRERVARIAALYIPVLIFLGLGMANSAERPLWRDEFATLAFANMSPTQLWEATQHVDFVLSPYYFLMGSIPGLTTTEFALRSVSLAAGALTLVVTGVVARRWWGLIGATVSVFVLALNPLFIELSATARPYGLAILFVASCVLSLDQALREGKRTIAWLSFSAFFILAGLSHLFAVLGVVATVFLVLPSGRKKVFAWLVSCICSAVALLPFAATAFFQQGQVSWIPALSLRSTVGSLASLVVFERDGELGKIQALGLALVFACFIITAIALLQPRLLSLLRPHVQRNFAFAAALLVLPWTLLVFESMLFTPFLRTTYLAPSLIGLALCMGGFTHLLVRYASDERIRRVHSTYFSPKISNMGIMVAALLLVMTVFAPLATSYAWLTKAWWIDDFPGLAAELAENSSRGDIIAFVQTGSESGVRLGLARSIPDRQFELDSRRRLGEGDQPTVVLRRVERVSPFTSVEIHKPPAGSTVDLVYTRGGFGEKAITDLNALGVRCSPEKDYKSVVSFGLLRYQQDACRVGKSEVSASDRQ